MRTTIDKAGRLLIAAGSGKQIDVEQVRPFAMPPGADIRLVDTSAAVPLVAQGHKDHEAVSRPSVRCDSGSPDTPPSRYSQY